MHTVERSTFKDRFIKNLRIETKATFAGIFTFIRISSAVIFGFILFLFGFPFIKNLFGQIIQPLTIIVFGALFTHLSYIVIAVLALFPLRVAMPILTIFFITMFAV